MITSSDSCTPAAARARRSRPASRPACRMPCWTFPADRRSSASASSQEADRRHDLVEFLTGLDEIIDVVHELEEKDALELLVVTNHGSADNDLFRDDEQRLTRL